MLHRHLGKGLALATVAALVTPAATSIGPASVHPIAFETATLANGLEVAVAEDHRAPVVAVAVIYKVGARNELPGETGAAHLFEHLMFKAGSDHVGSGEHPFLILRAGGSGDANTGKERTLFFERLPTAQLDLALFLEADRMRSLRISQIALDNQRDAVIEERRQNYDNQPYGFVRNRVDALAYDTFAYQHLAIGAFEDVRAATTERMQAFFDRFYGPENAVVAIAGDVAAADALARVRRHFASIPRRSTLPPVDYTEPPQHGERRATSADPLAPLPRLDIAYRIPGNVVPDHDALLVLGLVLSGGRSSRFEERLIGERRLAIGAAAAPDPVSGPSVMRIGAVASPGVSAADLEAALEQEVDRLQREPIERAELEAARARAVRAWIEATESMQGRAQLLAEAAALRGGAQAVNDRLARLQQVTAADVQRVAARYLAQDNRTVVTTQPQHGTGGGR